MKTNAEINESIALQLGWERNIQSTTFPWFDGTSSWQKVPDFCGEWEHAGPLLAELNLACDGVLLTKYEGGGIGVECFEEVDEDHPDFPADKLLASGFGSTLEEAASLTWIAWKEG